MCMCGDTDTETQTQAGAHLSKEAGGMALINEDNGRVLVCEVADFLERRNVSVHAEHAIGHNLQSDASPNTTVRG